MNTCLSEIFLQFYSSCIFLLFFQQLNMPFLAAILILIIISAFISMPIVYASLGYGVIFLLFMLAVGIYNYSTGGELTLKNFITQVALSIGFIIAALLLYYAGSLIDPPSLLEEKRREKENKQN